MSTHNILKTAICESISGRSTLTYQLSQDTELKTFHIRLVENTGNGYFSDNWLALDDLIKETESNNYITSMTINQLFNGKSVNTGAFLLSALKQEGFIKVSPNSKRAFLLNDQSSLLDDLNKLASKPKRKGVNK
ncbi:hypothetical protein JCM30760_11100 [Thiomicrorhabdus hydrogeniphila]